MTPSARKVHDFLNHPFTLIVLAVLTAVGAVIPFFGDIRVGRTLVNWAVHGVALAGLTAAMFYSIKVRQENIILRRIPETIHRINHDYRNVLSVLFGDRDVCPTDEARVKAEVRTLQSVCQKLSATFHDLTRKPCIVSVKLIITHDGHAYCETLVRSETMSRRDEGELVRFSLNTGRNPALDEALAYRPGRKSYFYSADLTKEKEGTYTNDRANWRQFYRSEIVCPIRYVKASSDGRPATRDDIGFLIVDTMSTNRLNEGSHVELLGACADQMYNFMSLVRGKYKVPPTD